MKKTRREFLLEAGKAGACIGFYEGAGQLLWGKGPGLPNPAGPPQDISDLRAEWFHPAKTYRPHTR